MASFNQDPDASIVALFKNMAIKNEAETARQNRPIFDDMEVVELRYPGSKNVGVYPALGFAQWVIDSETGEQMKQTYAERFRRQYQQFKTHATQTKSGTPLTHAPFLTEARRAEMRAQNIYTVEALAAIDGTELKNLGQGGRELKNQAMAFIEEAKAGAPNSQLVAELEALRAKNQTMEEDINILKMMSAAKPVESKHAETGQFESKPGNPYDDMTTEQLRAFIAVETGVAPVGNVARRTLVKMAQDAAPKAERVA
jgi:hypothetical protein